MSTSPSQRLPLVGLPERRLPPVRLLPGQRLAQLGELGAQPALGQLGQHPGVALPGDQRRQHRPTRHAQHVSGDRVQLDAGVLQGLLDTLTLRGVRLDQPLAIAGQVAQLADRGRGHEAAPQQPVLQQLRQPGGVTDIGLAAGQGILTWRALTSSSWKPRSSSTYQMGFQYWPVASITTWVTPSPASQAASASSPEVNVWNVRTSWSRPPCPSGTRTQATTSSLATSNPAQRATSSSTVDTSPCRWVMPGRAYRVNDAETRAHSNSSWCREGPRVRLINGLSRTKESRACPGTPDSHPSWRPPAMGVLSAKCREPLCGPPFPQVALDRQGQSYRFNRRTGMRSSIPPDAVTLPLSQPPLVLAPSPSYARESCPSTP